MGSLADHDLGTWTTDSTSLSSSMGPILDFTLKKDDTFLCVAGLTHASALYEVRQGL